MTRKNSKRTYIDPPNSERCEHNARVGRPGSMEYAQCGRRKVRDGYCEQHAKMADERVEAALGKRKPK